MKTKTFLCYLFLSFLGTQLLTAQINESTAALVSENMIFESKEGVIAVEAEFFYKQTKTDKRQWYITSKETIPTDEVDTEHIEGASHNAYIEILPDTRANHNQKLIQGENFSNEPGQLAITHYKVNIPSPGRYYVWARAFSSGSEDNGLHVGIDGTWPEHGQRMQWCEGKHHWTWASKQRTNENHCGVSHEIYLDIKNAGIHDIQISQREDGFELDKFLLTKDIDYVPEGLSTSANVVGETLPKPFPVVTSSISTQDKVGTYLQKIASTVAENKTIKATDFPTIGTNFYVDNNWLAINPEQNKEAKTSIEFPYESNTYDMVFVGVGENDGQSSYRVLLNNHEIGHYSAALSKNSFEEANQYNDLWENIALKKGDKITVISKIGSADGKEYSRGRWAGVIFAPQTKGKFVQDQAIGLAVKKNVNSQGKKKKTKSSRDGKGEVVLSGELKQWHKVTLILDGPFASETKSRSNPFLDYRMNVQFTHESGSPSYNVPAYFAADGNAGETSATEGIKWKAHLSPDKTGVWNYKISFEKGALVATADVPWMKKLAPYNGISGSFNVGDTDKQGRDFRAKGRLEYVGKHHLQFKGSGEYFYKVGADAPETLLAYTDFDNTIALKSKVPLKTYTCHLRDYKEGDPTWKENKGKGIIGALNYLADKGLNAFSFLTYNAGGDGDNVWPFVERDDKMHYDCSKLDQWQLVFDHAEELGLYLHFKTQENEIDDNRRGGNWPDGIKESLDGGELGPERRLYYRELIARFGYLLALNWNLGEENTQSTKERQEMAEYFQSTDPYKHNIVLHTFPDQQDKVYEPLLGKNSRLTGVSLQNSWDDVFKKTLHWVQESDKANKPWVVANDEQGSAAKGVPADPGYNGFDASSVGYDLHDVRKQTLWGNLMAGGAGVEYYFGYRLPENDLLMEDFRSRDLSWNFCRIAVDFLHKNHIPFQEMRNHNELIGNTQLSKEKFCLAKENDLYLVYLAYTQSTTIDLRDAEGSFYVEWFNPETGGALQKGKIKKVKGGKIVDLGNPPNNPTHDWVVLIRKKDLYTQR